LDQDLHEMKEEVKAVLTEGKMEAKVDRGRRAGENGGRLNPLQVWRHPVSQPRVQEVDKWCGEGPYRAAELGNV
jgi:hypothetical protein